MSAQASRVEEAARAVRNARFAAAQRARNADANAAAVLADRSRDALQRCRAAERRVKACSRAARKAAADAAQIHELVAATTARCERAEGEVAAIRNEVGGDSKRRLAAARELRV